MKKNYIGTIKSINQINDDTFKISIFSELNEAKAGQFVSILIPNKTMRRPFSISNFKKEEKGSIIEILFKRKGDGTKYISNLKVEEKIEFLAPLGNGFEIKNENSLLVGAGIGIAPMLFLKKELDEKNIKNYLISGFKNKKEAIQGSDKTIIGNSVLDYVEDIIKEKNIKLIYCCGPIVVLEKISKIGLKHNIEVEIAMEKIMACSIGVCRGCVIKLMKDNKITPVSVCKDGPIFKGSEVIWE